jgi:hypothetical protein
MPPPMIILKLLFHYVYKSAVQKRLDQIYFILTVDIFIGMLAGVENIQ